jgi:large subunit ribosomal protein L11
MAKKITAITRLQLPAGQAADGSLMGQAMRRHGVNVAAFCNAFNAATASDIGLVIPVVVTIYEDRSFSFVVKNPLVSRAESATREPAARI